MNNDSKVQIGSGFKKLNQFGQGCLDFSFKKQPRLKSILYAFILFSITGLSFYIGPKGRPTILLGLTTPESIANSSEKDIPWVQYDDLLNSKVNELKSKTKKRKKKVIYFPGPQLIKRPQASLIPPGALAKAILVTGASDGPVKAKLIEPLVVNGEQYLEAETIFLGKGRSSKNRLYILFDKMRLIDGGVQSIRAQAADISDKIVGLKGSKLGAYALKLGASAGLHFVAGLSQGMREKEVKDGVAVHKTDVKNAALNGASLAAIELAQETMSTVKNKKPVQELKPGTVIYILFEGSNL